MPGSEEKTLSESTVALHPVCRVDEIAEEDVRQFEHDGQIYAVDHTPRGFYATDGLCTHEEEFLADGLVLGKMIECLRHRGEREEQPALENKFAAALARADVPITSSCLCRTSVALGTCCH